MYYSIYLTMIVRELRASALALEIDDALNGLLGADAVGRPPESADTLRVIVNDLERLHPVVDAQPLQALDESALPISYQSEADHVKAVAEDRLRGLLLKRLLPLQQCNEIWKDLSDGSFETESLRFARLIYNNVVIMYERLDSYESDMTQYDVDLAFDTFALKDVLVLALTGENRVIDEEFICEILDSLLHAGDYLYQLAKCRQQRPREKD